MKAWLRLLRSRRAERELDAELRDHLERQVADYLSAGYSEAEARRRSRLEFGGLDQVKELCRDVRGTRIIEEVVQDVRYALRLLVKAPGFSVVAVATLALGIGTNSAVFSLTDALLLRPLPVTRPEELVQLIRMQGAQSGGHFSYPQARNLAEQPNLFTSICAFGHDNVNVGPIAQVEPVRAAWVTGSYFETFGVAPIAGRSLGPVDDRPGAAPVVVITDRYWQRQFGRDPAALGRSVLIEGVPVEIVGVTPPGFAGAIVGESADLTIAINARPQLLPERSFLGPGARWLKIMARPRASLEREELEAGMNVAWTQWLTASISPKASPEERARLLASSLDVQSAATGASDLRGPFRQPLYVVMALVTLVLLIACVNVANLLLSRAAVRQREMAMRLALGAGRGRILRQMLTESAMLTAAGAAIGVLLGPYGSRALVALMSGSSFGPDGDSAIVLDLAFNWRMFAFTALLAGATTLLFGALPAIRASSLEPTIALEVGSGRISEPRRWLAGGLVTGQVALSLLLLIGAGLFVRTLQNLRSLERGFRHEGMLVIDVDATRAVPQATGEDARRLNGDAMQAFNQQVFEFAARQGGVRSATMAAVTPLLGGGITQNATVNGRPVEGEVHFNLVGPRFFEVMATPLVHGREFTSADSDAEIPTVAIVNEAFARAHFAGADPVGQRVTHGAGKELQIVGLVRDAVYESLRQTPPPTMYVPFNRRDARMTLILYTPGAVAEAASAIRREIQPKLGGKPLRIRTLTAQLESSLISERMMATVASAFGVLALGLAAVGLYGLLAYWVNRRTHEIGIRVALGALRGQVVRLVLGDAVRMLALGTLIGIPAAWLLARSMASLLWGLEASDVPTFAGAVALLVAAGLLAAWIPARRAARVNPVVALRAE
jgi:putative ABC transport system permease protein